MVAVLLVAYLLHWLVLRKLGISNFENHVSSNLYAIALVTFATLIANNLYYFRPQKMEYSYLIVWCLFFSIVVTFLMDYVVLTIFNANNSLYNAIHTLQYFKVVFSFVILFCIAVTCVLWYTFEEIKVDEQRRSEILMLNKEAELSKLRQQLQPHFLFNSLNSINALVGSKPTEARKMIQQLSDFLRFTVKRESDQLIALSEELQHLRLYLEIEKVRFGNRLNTNFEVGEGTETLKIPALLLQPVVENAIKFGLYDTTDAVEIKVKTEIVDGGLYICIENPFDNETHASTTGTGFGLKSIRKRLTLLFNRFDLLQTEKDGHIFKTKITIPQLG